MTPLSNDLRLTPELKAKWIEALRSDEYLQGSGRLHSSGRYCCLGVLASVAGFPLDSISEARTLTAIHGARKLAADLDGEAGDRMRQCKLENMNDGVNGEDKHDFFDIADWIEAHVVPAAEKAT